MPLGHTTNSINLPLALGANYGLIIPCHRSICEVPIDQVPFVCGYAILIITIYSVNQLSPTLIKQFYHVEPFGVCFSTSKWARNLYRHIVILNNVCDSQHLKSHQPSLNLCIIIYIQLFIAALFKAMYLAFGWICYNTGLEQFQLQAP